MTPELPAGRPARFGRVAAVLAMAWVVLFAPQILRGRAFVIGDAASLRAFGEFSRARWLDPHERTHWNPYLFMGIPATASLQDSRPQYLPDALLSAFDVVHRLRWWPPLAIPLMTHLLGMCCAAALACSLWRVGTAAAVWAGLSWGLMPNLIVPFSFGHDAQLMATSLMPAVLLGIDRTIGHSDARSAWGAAIALAGAVGALLLAAYPQVVLLLMVVAAPFCFERAFAARRPGRLALVAAGVALGAAIGGAVWWPGLLYNAHSVRGGGIAAAEVGSWSLAWRDLAATAWPWAVGFGGKTYWGGLTATDFPPYLGATVLLFAAKGLGGKPRGAAILFAIVTAAGALLALGVRLGPLHALLWRLPMWSSFRVAVNAMLLAQLGAALLSARGIDRALRAPPAGFSREVRIVVGLAVAAVVGAGLPAMLPGGGPWGDWARVARPVMDGMAETAAHRAALDLALRAGLVVAAFCLVALAGRRLRTPAGAAAVVVLALDLALVVAPFLHRATGDLATLEQPAVPGFARMAAAEPLQRALSFAPSDFFWNDWVRWRARGVGGNHPAVNRTWDEMLKSRLFSSPRVLRGLAVKYVSGLEGDQDSTLVVPATGPGSTAVWRLKDALPRAFAVPLVRVIPNAPDLLEALASPEYDPAAVALTSEPGAAGTYPGATSCRLRWIRDDPDRLALDVEAADRAFVVIADADFPGWTCSLDGRPLRITRVNHLVRGAIVPAGFHRLEMHYVPEGWTTGRSTTRAALAFALAAALAWIAVQRLARPSAAR